MRNVSAIEEIKERLSIVDVISPHVVLKKSGRNYKGLCPFHSEKTPSFLVFPDKGNYHCFGCGANGDVLSFVMRSENLDFGEALRTLAERTGVMLRDRTPADAVKDERVSRMFDANATAAAYFNNLLVRSEAARVAREYLARRGISAASVESFQLGFALDSWDALSSYLIERGFTADEILGAGLVVEREGYRSYDRFRGRLMFPVRDARGRVTGFGGRSLGDDQPKYLNTSQTAIFDKGASLYGIDLARTFIREFDQVVIVEGYVDALMSHQAGVRNVVASLGTALTERQLAALKKLTKHIVLALDPDVAGDEATWRGLDVAKQVFDQESVPVPNRRGLIQFQRRLDADIRVARLPRGKDPDEVVREDVTGWRTLIENAPPVIDYYFDIALADVDVSSSAGKETVVQRLLPLVRDLGPGVHQDHYLQRLARELRISERMLELRLAEPQARQQKAVAAEQEKPKHLSLDEYLVALFLRYESARAHLFELDPEALRHEASRQLLIAMQSVRTVGGDMRAALVEVVDGDLVEAAGGLIQATDDHPMLLAEALEREIGECVAEIRRRNLRRAIDDLSFLLSEAEEGGDADGQRGFREKQRQLLAELSKYEHNNSKARVWRW